MRRLRVALFTLGVAAVVTVVPIVASPAFAATGPSASTLLKSAGIKPGSVAAIIYKSKVVYAVFADEGPNNIIGEASYATAKALGIDPNPATGGVDSGVTYIVFPGKIPSTIESNSSIDSAGAAAANAFVG